MALAIIFCHYLEPQKKLFQKRKLVLLELQAQR
jgi:hypothetical protein